MMCICDYSFVRVCAVTIAVDSRQANSARLVKKHKNFYAKKKKNTENFGASQRRHMILPFSFCCCLPIRLCHVYKKTNNLLLKTLSAPFFMLRIFVVVVALKRTTRCGRESRTHRIVFSILYSWTWHTAFSFMFSSLPLYPVQYPQSDYFIIDSRPLQAIL